MLAAVDGSENSIELDGWAMVLAALDGCTVLNELGKVACTGLMAGRLQSLEAKSQDQGLARALVPYLGRSESCLTTLDIRFASIHVTAMSLE